LIGAPTSSHAQAPLATVTFDNRSGEAALVKLIGSSRRSTSVPNGHMRTVSASGGQYFIMARYGTSAGHYRYAQGDPFNVTQTANQRSVITITLHPVVNGNYATRPISEGEFNR
jgi:hypothetical protein